MQTKVTFKNQQEEQLKPFTRENIGIGKWYIVDDENIVLGIDGFSGIVAIDVNGDTWHEDPCDEYKIKPVQVEIVVNN